MSLERYFHRYGRATFTLFLVNLAVYIVEAILSRNPFFIDTAVLATIGQWNYAVLQGAWWQPFTAMFAHVNLIHLAFNMYFLLSMGSQLERIVGPRRMATIYVVSGLAGNLLTLLLAPPGTVSAGASGALFGILGALMAIIGTVGGDMTRALMNAFLLFLINSFLPGVNAYAHLGGLLAGILIGYRYGRALRRRLTWAYTYH